MIKIFNEIAKECKEMGLEVKPLRYCCECKKLTDKYKYMNDICDTCCPDEFKCCKAGTPNDFDIERDIENCMPDDLSPERLGGQGLT